MTYLLLGLFLLLICYACFYAGYRKGEADVHKWRNRVIKVSKEFDV